MSEYIVIELEFNDTDVIRESLEELGYTFEYHIDPKNLVGYSGDIRQQKANFIIRKKFISSASNDIGFLKKANGKYELIISEYDQACTHGKIFTQKFKQIYSSKQSIRLLKKKGYKVKHKKVEEDGTIEIVFH
jgi:hypothetical protein